MASEPEGKKTDWKVARRWTEDLVKDGFTPVSDVFLEHYHELDITTAEAMLVIHLMKYKWNEKLPYPGFKALSKKMGVTPTAVRNHARSLDNKGYLRRIARIGDTNQFDLKPLFDALENLRRKKEEEKTVLQTV